jgi:Flp pilus assembly protein TadG
MKLRRQSRGSTGLEFTLVGLPLLFVLISTFEICRAMWTYQTLAFAIKEGARYAVVHGQSCSIPPNACTVTISQIASVIQTTGGGLASDTLTVTFTPSKGTATTCLLQNCIANYATAAWPPANANAPGEIVLVSGIYPFSSVLAMYWPGTKPINSTGTVVNLSADARESMQY